MFFRFSKLILAAALVESVRAQCSSIAEIACSTDDFSTLCTAVTEAGLAEALSEGSWTVFAPTNEAFANLGDTLDAVLADKDLLTDVLLFHAVSGEVLSTDLKCTERVEMANKKDSRTVCRGDTIYQKGAGNPRSDMPAIVDVDIEACNGYIHVISEVMLP
ncbi:hypothetical protein FisN_9Hh382 [Fistulifera solaris]|uniref:FAS1 domain-containing protein n=1 Tax=Fistulifera solaris TaxID=1519565 RepID=A0A1Z5KCZ0_FISSO|nr:hypothetical protein FisN_9Hh382 [Fistulifera solaris]|eukprot:GAX24129.1 hypothetical protein FisN_9Hh382 [Fistulifera solaris]